ncbi:MAG: glutamate racemase [Neolewinella sp.]|jgi:glutamate racemase
MVTIVAVVTATTTIVTSETTTTIVTLQQLQHQPIGVFDSGIGGLSVANAISGLLPRESLLYVADNAYAPYGPRPEAEILARSRLITRHLLNQGVKMIVIACNTATSVAIGLLREEYPEVLFVGLEPALKQAAKARRVGVIATATTLRSPRYLALRERYMASRPVREDACVGLVPLIEAEVPGSPLLTNKLKTILEPMLADKVDALVLGCSHYAMIQEDIAAVCGPGVEIIDPSSAAARQVERLLSKHSLLFPSSPSTCVPAHNFYSTGTSVPLQRSLLHLLRLNQHRKLVVPQHILV